MVPKSFYTTVISTDILLKIIPWKFDLTKMIIGLKTENKTIVNFLAAFLIPLHMSTMLYVQFVRIWEPNVLDFSV